MRKGEERKQQEEETRPGAMSLLRRKGEGKSDAKREEDKGKEREETKKLTRREKK